MLLSLFTRDTAGKSIADFIISFSEFIRPKSMQAVVLSDILSPAPACQPPEGASSLPHRLASAMPTGVLPPASRDGVPLPRRTSAATTRVFRSSGRAAVSQSGPGQARSPRRLPLSATASRPSPEATPSIVDRRNSVPLKVKIGNFGPGASGGALDGLARWRHSARSATARHGSRRSMPSTPGEPLIVSI